MSLFSPPNTNHTPKQARGLQAVHEVRDQRIKGRFSRPGGVTWLLFAAGVGLSLGAYQYIAGKELRDARGELLGKQMAVAMTVGEQWYPLRDRIEAATLEASKEYRGDFIDPSIASWNFRSQPGIYLRLRAADASSPEALRKAAGDSARDGFTGCFLQYANPAAAKGAPDAGAFPDQPWNLRQAYAATRVLSEGWKRDVEAAEDALRLRVFEQQYDKAIREEIPRAIDIVKRAEFYLLVLDEDAPEATVLAGDKPVTTDVLQLVPHAARVHLFALQPHGGTPMGKEILRLRRTASASFVMAGERAAVDDETRNAMQRQVNNCALAQEVKAAIGEATATR
jgi:hypothetical protein